jgi:hypothetical protein
MRLPILPLLMAISVAPASGQAFVRVSAGVTGSTALVKDFILGPITAGQTIAPGAVIMVGFELSDQLRIGAEGRLAVGKLSVDIDGASDDVHDLSSLTISIFADGPITGAFRWEAAVGMLRYQPEHETGIFSDGAPSPLVFGAGVSWARPVSSSLAVIAAARYDYHTFITDRLSNDGYSSGTAVHRAGLSVGLERRF